jgi:DNA polymerase-3 subunit beta
MHVTFAKKDMVAALSTVSRFIDTKSTMPVLSNVLLETGGGKLTLRGTNLQIGASTQIDSEVKTDGSVCIQGKPLLERVKAMPDGPVILAVQKGRATLSASGSARKFVVQSIPGDDYPPTPEAADKSVAHTLPSGILATAIDRVFGAISLDETRAHLNAALFERVDDTLRIVSTDGHRLHVTEAKLDGIATFRLLVPRASLAEVRRLCDTCESVTFTSTPTKAFFDFGGYRFHTSLVDATFPPWEQVVPKTDAKRTIDIHAPSLKNVVMAVAVASTKVTGRRVVIELKKGSDEVKVSTSDPEGGDSEDIVKAETTWGSDGLRIAVAGEYVCQACDAFEDGTVTLATGGEMDPIKLTRDTTTTVIMPMRA